MKKFNPHRKNGEIYKLFIKPNDACLVRDFQILYPEEYVEVYEVSYPSDNYEFACYKNFYTQDLPLLLKCNSDNELHILEAQKNYTI